ncbi:hypothetical protein KGQ34_00815 [Patescibacteria group bacterium]|nr:hypothetical protein [Patescibacteria group bacterium]
MKKVYVKKAKFWVLFHKIWEMSKGGIYDESEWKKLQIELESYEFGTQQVQDIFLDELKLAQRENERQIGFAKHRRSIENGN